LLFLFNHKSTLKAIFLKANRKYFEVQIAEFEGLIGPEMDEAEIFFTDAQLGELSRNLAIYS